jgi:hypothetical protein
LPPGWGLARCIGLKREEQTKQPRLTRTRRRAELL